MMNNKIIAWRKVIGIAAIQGVVTLTWVIYNLYFPKMLVELGLTVGIAKIVLIIEHFLEAIIEPIFGNISDKMQNKIGSKIPLISKGIILASLFFMSIPVFFILIKPKGIFAYILPILAIFWASAMAIFRSPAISLIAQTAPMNKLPQAVSIITLIGGIVGAFKFDVFGLILKLGSNWAFFIGSISFLIAGFYLRFLYKDNSQLNVTENELNQKLPPVKISLIPVIMLLGISISFSLRFILPSIANNFTLLLGENNTKLAMMLFLLFLAILSLPAGKLATIINNYNAILGGLLITIITVQLLTFIPSILIICLIALNLSLILNGIIPLVIALMPPERVGLAIGCYFGGFGAGLSFFDLILPKITLEQGISGSAISLLIAIIIIKISHKN